MEGGQYIISRGFKKKDQNKGGVPRGPTQWGTSGDYQDINFLCYSHSGSAKHCLSVGAAQGTGYNQNSTACGPHEVAIDTNVEGASELIIICMCCPSNCCGVAGGCVGATAMGIKKGL